ncbi:tryptophan--tRNA ligase ['Camptotheca acuminata' phytoplasma]|uniref:tryptophan--tRNA ligase n=1 Tax='Camptotheca acuminata' phytoplasma TaxID=3239192 RepID=UPI00351A322D
MFFKEKKRLITGIKPTGDLTLGNYIGLIKPFVLFQEKKFQEYEFYFFIADLHALTNFQEPTLLKQRIIELLYFCLASGINLDQTNIFIQSEIPQHPYLSYIMESTSYLGELQRMIQFKEKKNSLDTTRTSIFTYPILMSSDILLYDSDVVVVGSDQEQHLELTRVLAKRFNYLYGETFTIPKTLKLGNMVKSLNQPQKKMSKSSSKMGFDDKGCIYIFEDVKNIRKKILRSVTDSENIVRYNIEEKPGISNLLTIYSSLKKWDFKKTEQHFQNFSYKDFKEEVANVVVEEIKNIQTKYFFLKKNVSLKDILEKGTQKALNIADFKLKEIKRKLGLEINF